MSYTPTNWKSGDVVTSAKLNKLEQGVAEAGGGVLVVYAETDTETGSTSLYSTWQEIHDAMLASGAVLFFPDSERVVAITEAFYSTLSSEYIVMGGNTDYLTPTSDGYPTDGGGK